MTKIQAAQLLVMMHFSYSALVLIAMKLMFRDDKVGSIIFLLLMLLSPYFVMWALS